MAYYSLPHNYSASSVWLLTSVSCIFYPWFDIYKAHATKNNVTDCYCGQQLSTTSSAVTERRQDASSHWSHL